MSYDGDEADYGWDTYMDRLIAREEQMIRAELELVRDDTDHHLVSGNVCGICARPWPCPHVLPPEQLALGYRYRGTTELRPNPEYL